MAAAALFGLHGIAATDHYDIGSLTSYGQEWVFEPADYLEYIQPKRRLPSQRKAGDPPGFLGGIEIGYIPQYSERLKDLMADYPWDIIIMSLHLIDGHDPFHAPDLVYSGGLKDVYRKIIAKIAESAEMMPQANIIGHYDYFSRYTPQDNPKMLYSHAPKEFDQLFKSMIKNDQALEINSGTIWNLHSKRGYSLQDAMPDLELLFRYREMGGKLISLASDAHHFDNVGRLIKETCDWLVKHGFREYVWFEEQKICHGELPAEFDLAAANI